MGQFYYNRLRNSRIKSTSLGFLFIAANLAFICSYDVNVGKDTLNIHHAVLLSIVPMVLLFMLALIPFGQVIETDSSGYIVIYYKLGPKKIKFRRLGKLIEVNLQQDPKRYYSLIVKTEDTHPLILEKYPTEREAKERFNEFKKQIL